MSASQLNLKALPASELLTKLLELVPKVFNGHVSCAIESNAGRVAIHQVTTTSGAKELKEFIEWARPRPHIACSHVEFKADASNAGEYVRYASSNGISATMEVGGVDPRRLRNKVEALEAQFRLLPYEDVVQATGMTATEKSALELRERSVADLKVHLDQLGELLSTITAREVEARRLQQAELEKVYREKHSQLESEQALRMAELDAQRQRNEAALEEAKKALRDREAEFELRESKYVRRDLLKKLNDLLDQFKNFKISEQTSSKRLPVFFAVCLMCLVSGGLGGLGGYRYFETLDLHFLVPFTGGALGLTATLLYYVKWSDRWFREHADAELQSMRYKSDMLRASWIAELVSEWAADGKAPPPELLEVFSKNLFQPNAGMTEVEHPAESFVGLLKRVQRLDVAKDHVTIEADPGRKA